MDSSTQPRAGLPYQWALTRARDVAFAVQANPNGINGIWLVGDLGYAMRNSPPPTTVDNISLVISSRFQWTEFRDELGPISPGQDCAPRLARFHAARKVLRYTSHNIPLDPLGPYAEDTRLWVDGNKSGEPLLDLFILYPDWSEPEPYFAKQVCSVQRLNAMSGVMERPGRHAVPFQDGIFRVKVQKTRITGGLL